MINRDRRRFITRLGGWALLAGVGGLAGAGLKGCKAPEGGPLQADLASLFNHCFALYASRYNRADLFRSLMQKGVISVKDGVHHERLVELAPREALVVYQDFYYTETELALYALAYLTITTPA